MGEVIAQTKVSEPSYRPMELRLNDARVADAKVSDTKVSLGEPSLGPELIDRLIRRTGVEAVVRREHAKESGSLADYLQASGVLNLTEHRLDPDRLATLTKLTQATPAKLFESLRRSEKAEHAEAALIEKLHTKLAGSKRQGRSELRFAVEPVGEPISDVPSFMLMLSLPDSRDPRDWVKGQPSGRRFDRNTGAVVLRVSSPELRRACDTLRRDLPTGVGSIQLDDLKRMLTFSAPVRTAGSDGFEGAVGTDPASTLLRSALLRHPTENQIHLLPRAVLRSLGKN